MAVLPQVDERTVELKESDLRIETFKSGGKGGQSVNTTDSAVRIMHVPTGVVVSMQDERSQHQNRQKAMRVLRARIHEAEMRKRAAARSDARKSQTGSGDRSERIRTYNFPQGRVTDHRVNLTLHQLDLVLGGEDLDKFIDALESQEAIEALHLASDEGEDA